MTEETQRMRRDGAPQDWISLREANGDLFAQKPSILERYYAPETLRSDTARRTFVLPDAGVGYRGAAQQHADRLD